MASEEDYTARQLDNFHLKNDNLSLQASSINKTPRHAASPVDQEARDAALKAELKGLKRMNAVVEGILSSLDQSKANMGSVSTTISNSNQLLDLWIRILSQSEHTQRLVLSPHWQGGNKDIEDEKAEIETKLREQEQRKAELRERQLERERAAAAAAAAATAPTTREVEQNRPLRGSTRGTRRSRVSGSSRGSSDSRIGPSSVASNRSASEPGSTVGKGTRGGTGRITRGLPRPRGGR